MIKIALGYHQANTPHDAYMRRLLTDELAHIMTMHSYVQVIVYREPGEELPDWLKNLQSNDSNQSTPESPASTSG